MKCTYLEDVHILENTKWNGLDFGHWIYYNVYSPLPNKSTNDITDALFEYLISQEQEEMCKNCQLIIWLSFHLFPMKQKSE